MAATAASPLTLRHFTPSAQTNPGQILLLTSHSHSLKKADSCGIAWSCLETKSARLRIVMSDASQIPNLLSLRGRGGGRRGRGRGGAQTPGETRQDTAIQGTDNDAAVSRLSAVDVGYLDDPYAQFFVQSMGAPTRRLPIINRGTLLFESCADDCVDVDVYQGHTPGPRLLIPL